MKYLKDLRMRRSHVNISMMVNGLRFVDEIISLLTLCHNKREFVLLSTLVV